jgi:hypothetical protein
MKLYLSVRETDGRLWDTEVEIDQVLLVGYTGRDQAAVRAHIRELEVLGVPPPDRVPSIYVVSPELLTSATRLLVDHPETSGEVEFFFVNSGHGWLVGVGSDHTDRHWEAIDVAASKARCGKVHSREVWRLAALEPHWDALGLRAWTTDDRSRHIYQEGRTEMLLTVPQLIAEVEAAGYHTERSLMFGGTLPTIGGFIYGSRFEVELRDPVLDRTLACSYRVLVTAPNVRRTDPLQTS